MASSKPARKANLVTGSPSSGVASAGEARARLAAQFVPSGASVLEITGGGGWLQRLLPPDCSHQSIRLDRPLAVAAGKADIVVLLDVLERANDPENLIAELARALRPLVLSYRPRDFDEAVEIERGNERLGLYDLTRMFDRHGLRIECSAPLGDGEMMMRLDHADRSAPPATSRIAVLTSGDNFGDRLGLQMLGSLLPGEAEVDYFTCATLGEREADYDLAIIGAGNALTPAMLNDETFGLVTGARAAIGIFGVQHRDLTARAAVEKLISRLDTWYARHEDDLLLYGRGNVAHLGDWLIDEFPLGNATEATPLAVGEDELRKLGLDAATTIRRHRSVLASDRAALLCALTSADMAAWCNTNEGAGSAEFRSMLLDIFGRSYPEGEFFLVDRDAVRRYRARVHANIAALRERIASLLRESAVAAAA